MRPAATATATAAASSLFSTAAAGSSSDLSMGRPSALVPAGSPRKKGRKEGKMDTAGLPPGWHVERRKRAKGGSYLVVLGPDGARVPSRLEAWRRHNAAAEEGLQLHPSTRKATSYEGASLRPSDRYQARGRARGKRHGKSLVHLETAVEAAVAYASYVQEQGGEEAEEGEMEVENENEEVRELPAATPATPAVRAVRAALEALRLEQYAAALEKLGYDDLEYLARAGPQRLREIGAQAGMKPGHASKFADLLFDPL